MLFERCQVCQLMEFETMPRDARLYLFAVVYLQTCSIADGLLHQQETLLLSNLPKVYTRREAKTAKGTLWPMLLKTQAATCHPFPLTGVL